MQRFPFVCHKTVFFLFQLFFCITALRAQENELIGRELTNSLYSILQNNGFTVEKQDLTPSDSHNFPQNVIVSIPAGSAERFEIPWYEASINTVIFSFTQEFVAKNTDSFLNVLENLKDLALPYECIVLLSANDSRPSLNVSEVSNTYHPAGSKRYAQELGNADTMCALVISESRRGIRTISAGGQNTVCPKWLLKTLLQTAQEHTLETRLPNHFLLLYKWGILRGPARLSPFLEQGIPAIGISLTFSEADKAFLLAIAKALVSTRSTQWEENYLFIPFAKGGFWFSESFLVLSYLVCGAAILFFLSFSFFVKTSKNRALIQDARRSSFVPPAIIALTTVSLCVSQLVFGTAVKNPILLIGIKLLLAFLLSFILFSFQIRTNFHSSFGASSFQMQYSAALNVFIFSTLNINLLFYFLLEFLLFTLARNAKKAYSLVVTFMLPILPLLPLAHSFLQNTSYDSLSQVATLGVLHNMLFALLIFPFQMQWFRILIVLDVLNPQKAHSKKRAFLRGSLAIGISLLILALAYFVSSTIVAKTNIRLNTQSPIHITEVAGSTDLYVENAISDFMELSQREIEIESRRPVIRYDVSVEQADGSEAVPLYDSNYDYSFEGKSKVYFHIPDYPQGRLSIVYFAEKNQKDIITVSAYMQDTENRGNILHETTTISTEDFF